jgi:hypothetical protein
MPNPEDHETEKALQESMTPEEYQNYLKDNFGEHLDVVEPISREVGLELDSPPNAHRASTFFNSKSSSEHMQPVEDNQVMMRMMRVLMSQNADLMKKVLDLEKKISTMQVDITVLREHVDQQEEERTRPPSVPVPLD